MAIASAYGDRYFVVREPTKRKRPVSDKWATGPEYRMWLELQEYQRTQWPTVSDPNPYGR